MTSLALKRSPLAFEMTGRAAAVTGAYLAAAAAVLLTVILLRGLVPAAILSRFLGFVFIASLAAGLEPGTVKGAALGEGGVGAAAPAAYLGAAAIKGLAASPALALLWRFADPGISLAALAWTPALAVTGFCATDLRALADLRGGYALAIGVKQGSLAGGVVVAGALVGLGVPVAGAIGGSSLARVAFLGLVANRVRGRDVRSQDPGPPVEDGSTGRQVRRLLGDGRWMELAAVSAIAAAGGAADRLFGLRYLTPAAYGGYYVTYELFSKFWLIPYLLSPILFARRASGAFEGAGSDPFVGAAWALTAAAGAAFVALTAGLVTLAPALLRQVVGASFGWSTAGFAAAVVVCSFSQLRLAQLQGAGRSGVAVWATAFGAAISIPLFFYSARALGGGGLLLAWLAKSVLELAALTLGASAWRNRGDGTPQAG
jgi:hypothetical protein